MSKNNHSFPWGWRPPKDSWHKNLCGLIPLWHPVNDLQLDEAILRHCLMDAVENHEDWLLHPCLNAITLQTHDDSLHRDFQLAVWIAAHSQKPLGYIHIPCSLWMWSPDGGVPIPAGKYNLQNLGVKITESQWPCAISLDVMGHSVGLTYPDTWTGQEPLSEKQRQQLNNGISNFLRAMHIAKSVLSEFEEWLVSITQVVVPFYSDRNNVFRSSSQAEIPGLIFCDLFSGEISILEALAHESSHLYFFLTEARGPLVDQQHNGIYSSPLRKDPRPLRGIFLAYHALAYICALYTDLNRKNSDITEFAEKELSTLRAKLKDAEHILASHQHFLTDSGVEFFSLTKKVAHYGEH